MNIVKTVITVGGIVASSGIGTIIGNVVSATTPANVGKLTKISIKAGTAVLGFVIGDMCVDYIDATVTKVANECNKVKEKVAEDEKETEE